MSEAELKRVRVLEPRPDQPARAIPIFNQVLAAARGGMVLLVIGALLGALTVTGCLLGWLNPAPMVPWILSDVVLVCWSVRNLRFWRPLAELAEAPFTELAIPPEGLYLAGSTVSFRLPGNGNVQWALARLPRAARLHLAAQRRVWLLGPDDKGRRFLQLPGVLWPYRVRVADEQPAGAERLEPVERRPVPPHEDQVLLAHRRRVVHRVLSVIAGGLAVIALMAVLSIWSGDRYSAILTTWLHIAIAGYGISRFLRLLKPLPSTGTWTELPFIPAGYVRTGLLGLATYGGRVQLPDGGWVHLGLRSVDPALAADIFASQQVWVIGHPVRGRPVYLGVPGYPVYGVGRMLSY